MTPATPLPSPPLDIPNELRCVVYVAARGVVGKTELGAFQRSLPEDEWLDASRLNALEWDPIKPVLAWAERVSCGTSRPVTLREILDSVWPNSSGKVLGRLPQLQCDLMSLIATDSPLLDQTVEVPHTEHAVRLSRARSHRMRLQYEAALRLCAHTCERERFGHQIDFDAAVVALRRVLTEMAPEVLYEAVEHRDVLRAVLARRAAMQLLGVEFGVVYGAQHVPQVHRVYIKTRLKLDALAKALDVPRRWLCPSVHRMESVETYALPAVEADLRAATRRCLPVPLLTPSRPRRRR